MNLVKLLANNWQPIAIIALVGTGLAVSHHGNCIDGFGHHGLQLYNRALGYGN